MKQILIVEDEEHLAIGMKYNFEAEGYHVLTVGDGRAALDLLMAEPDKFDLIVLDIMLPNVSGYAICEALRESGNNVPVLMLSARTLLEDRVRGFDIGADQYLTKPFELDELLSMARNLIARRAKTGPAAAGNAKPPEAAKPGESAKPGEAAKPGESTKTGEVPKGPATSSFGNTRVNFDTYEVTVAGKPLRLTYMEMKLLRYFAEHEGLVISRGELLENVWGEPSTISTRTVDNFLVRFRKYFEEDPSKPAHFLSVRGAGYRFVRDQETPPEDGASD